MHSISVWEKESFFSPKDVIIAGSGLVGLWCAYYLKIKDPSLSVAIIDRGIIPTGASTRNAGFACFGSATELLEDIVNMGEEKMLQIVEMRYKGLERIQKVFRKKEIDFNICGGYELITSKNKYSRKELKSHIKRLNKLIAKVIKSDRIFKFADDKIKHFGFRNVDHLLENNLEGYLHSGKLCQVLLQKVQCMGVTVLNGLRSGLLKTLIVK